ncbi:alpha/beta hydrolase [Salisediminibacterium selenitireducens]|uniref:Alpha/beta hydrolase fold-5 domain-containing protein n=1 Tax=Bacillus selenitireducens (strain ATCC 700615 / DSM 15326 / MLS10) TaxID=439292 RepID=D6XX70_BACIE|nr:alpha/beta hydrolase [Salisediminibacterium selenitireducens]ADH97927.1 hypothetical protein Bsel_0387 [[Bacillus] selenitireducens MLS10]
MAVIWEHKWKILLGVALAITAIIWLLLRSYPAGSLADDAMAGEWSDVKDENGAIRFIAEGEPLGHVMYYPGGLVRPESYSYLASQLAEAGVETWVIPMPLNLAVLGISRGEQALGLIGGSPVVIGGHSLGGAMAARFAKDHEDQLDGVFFHGAYPDEGGRLDGTSLSVLSIQMEEDRVLNSESYEEGLGYMPDAFFEEWIEGGNHASFGDYGPQRGDGEATISHEEAVEQIVDLTVDWLESLQ